MKKLIPILGIVAVVLFLLILVITNKKESIKKYNTIEGEILAKNDDILVFKDNSDLIYKLSVSNANLDIGDKVILEYTGVLNKSTSNKDVKVLGGTKLVNATIDDLSTWDDGGIFSQFYKQAYNKLITLSLDEKIGQLLLARYPDSKEGNKYNLSGYVFYEKDFKDKTEEQVLEMIDSLQATSKIPLLTAVDEEGGSVVRVSSNPNLAPTPFKGPKELYDEGGLDLIKSDTIAKSKILSDLHLNVNLAPVVDIATNSSSYIYPRTIGYGVDVTSKYANSVIFASKGTDVSYVLKHFPGYGDNVDTHTGEALDYTDYDDIVNNNILPFKAGIEAGAEAVLISHNIITSIDEEPASLSSGVHNLLKSNLGFTGVIITDDLDMGATSDFNNRYLNALLAGNDLLIVTNYEDAFNQIKNGVTNNEISEDYINKLALKVLAWKYYKLLILENNK